MDGRGLRGFVVPRLLKLNWFLRSVSFATFCALFRYACGFTDFFFSALCTVGTSFDVITLQDLPVRHATVAHTRHQHTSETTKQPNTKTKERGSDKKVESRIAHSCVTTVSPSMVSSFWRRRFGVCASPGHTMPAHTALPASAIKSQRVGLHASCGYVTRSLVSIQ